MSNPEKIQLLLHGNWVGNADIFVMMLVLLELMIPQGPLLLTWFNFNPGMDK